MNFDALVEAYEAAKEARNELGGYLTTGAENDPAMPSVMTEEQKKAFEAAKLAQYRAESALLGHPDSFEKARCWMVDVSYSPKCPQSEEVSEKQIKEFLDAAEEGRASEEIDKHGALAENVRKLMAKYHLTDSGHGGGGWDLGCHSTESEAQSLIRELHSRFQKAIDAGLIRVTRKKWSLRIK